jgi:hypothetical protein
MQNIHSTKQPTRISSWLAGYCLENSGFDAVRGKRVIEGGGYT